MKQAEPGRGGRSTHPETLLELWMGQAPKSTPAHRPWPRGAVIATALGTLVIIVLMAKYAIDVLAIVVALVAVGVVLHVLGLRLAESDVLSPGWFLIIVLAGLLVAYALFVPANSVAGLGRYMPKWVVSTLEWSESRGWGRRVLVGPGGDEGTGQPLANVEEQPGAPVAATSGPATPQLVVSASTPMSLEGEPVTLMARTSYETAAAAGGSVTFYDGTRLIGRAELKAEGRTRIAYLTVRGLGVGQHEIRASLAGALPGRGGVPSTPVRHTVLRRAR